ncbi:hypothetical protein Leryth_015556 [Lithospermum erythrorhizon]|nr:hypothetical protein Leryth_015556 [Lithospermum erythrorhizon]
MTSQNVLLKTKIIPFYIKDASKYPTARFQSWDISQLRLLTFLAFIQMDEGIKVHYKTFTNLDPGTVLFSDPDIAQIYAQKEYRKMLTSGSPDLFKKEPVYASTKAKSRAAKRATILEIESAVRCSRTKCQGQNLLIEVRETVEELIEKCKEIVDKEGEKILEEEYVNETDPSILRFLLASGEEVSSIRTIATIQQTSS